RGEGDPMKAEFLLPDFVEELLKRDEIDVRVFCSNDTWYGLTYKEDIPSVREAFKRMVDEGVYPSPLFTD
ncbi:MAG: nucleotidyltransferase, partial [Candidatus Weimeria sp.]